VREPLDEREVEGLNRELLLPPPPPPPPPPPISGDFEKEGEGVLVEEAREVAVEFGCVPLSVGEKVGEVLWESDMRGDAEEVGVVPRTGLGVAWAGEREGLRVEPPPPPPPAPPPERKCGEGVETREGVAAAPRAGDGLEEGLIPPEGESFEVGDAVSVEREEEEG